MLIRLFQEAPTGGVCRQARESEIKRRRGRSRIAGFGQPSSAAFWLDRIIRSNAVRQTHRRPGSLIGAAATGHNIWWLPETTG